MWKARSAPSGWRRRAGAPVRDEPSDDQLIEGLRKREPAALGALHDRYSGSIYNLALRMVRSGPDAEDITHDVLLRAYERLPSDSVVDLRPWLYRVTLNRCYDVLRTAKRLGEANGEKADETATHVDPYAQSELAGLVARALDALTPRQRAAMLLKDVHGLSLHEVAATLHITVGSTEVLLARARSAFRASFDSLCPGGRPVPSWGILAALPATLAPQPLPPALAAPLAPPAGAAPVGLAPAPLVPLPPAIGGGLAAALSGSLSAKLAIVMLAAGAAVGTVGVGSPSPHQAAARQTVARAVASHAPGAASIARTPAPVAGHLATTTAGATTSGPPTLPVAVTTATPSTTPASTPTPTASAAPPSTGYTAQRVARVIARLRTGQPVPPRVVRAMAAQGVLPKPLLGRLALAGKLPAGLSDTLALSGGLPPAAVTQLALHGDLRSGVVKQLALRGDLAPPVVGRLALGGKLTAAALLGRLAVAGKLSPAQLGRLALRRLLPAGAVRRLALAGKLGKTVLGSLALRGSLGASLVRTLALRGSLAARVIGRLALQGRLQAPGLLGRLALKGAFSPAMLRNLAERRLLPLWVIRRLVANGTLPRSVLPDAPAPTPSPSATPSPTPSTTPSPSPTA